MPSPSDTQLWARIEAGGWNDLSTIEAARLVKLTMPLSERKRSYRLGLLVQENRLTVAERGELERLIQKGHSLTLMKARAQLFLDGPRGTSPVAVPRPARATAASRRRQAS